MRLETSCSRLRSRSIFHRARCRGKVPSIRGTERLSTSYVAACFRACSGCLSLFRMDEKKTTGHEKTDDIRRFLEHGF